MCTKKTVCLTFLVLLLGLVGSASAAENWYSAGGGSGNKLWDTATNWWGGIPDNTDTAFIDRTDYTPVCIVDSTVAGVCDSLAVGQWGSTVTFNITGGTLTIDYNCR